MDISAIITIVIAVAAVYFVIKFIISPLLKLIAGIVILLVAIYILQRYFNLNINQYLGPFSGFLNVDAWVKGFFWVINSAVKYIVNLFSIFKLFSK